MTPRPLEGKVVIVTRPREQAAALVDRLAEAGARAILAPAIAIRPPVDPRPLLDALGRLGEYDWLVFTSARGVEAVSARLGESGRGMDELSGLRIAAVGPGTAAALQARGLPVEIVARPFTVEALADAIVSRVEPRGLRFLLPRAERANPVLPRVLREHGARVTEVAAYGTAPVEGDDEARAALGAGEADYLTFTSASTVRGFIEAVGAEAIRGAGPRLRVATIGPETSRAARESGIEVHVEAAVHTISGLVAAIVTDRS